MVSCTGTTPISSFAGFPYLPLVTSYESVASVSGRSGSTPKRRPPRQPRPPRTWDPIEIPEFVRKGIRSGLSPQQLWANNHRRRSVWLAALIEEARQQSEFAAFEPTPANVELLRDTHQHRWERIAIRVFGDPRRTREAMDLYDEAKGRAGAAQESYTGRGRRFPRMKA